MSLRGGDLKAAQDYFKKTLNLSEQLARQDPENAQTGLELGVSFWKLGHACQAAKQYPEADAWFRKAIDQLSRLKAQGKLPPAMENMLATGKKELPPPPR